jgi:hypothetical protein
MEAGSVDDLRTRIWDYLYRLGREQQIAVIAEQMGETPRAIQQAVDDPWFTEQDGTVAIARSDR